MSSEKEALLNIQKRDSASAKEYAGHVDRITCKTVVCLIKIRDVIVLRQIRGRSSSDLKICLSNFTNLKSDKSSPLKFSLLAKGYMFHIYFQKKKSIIYSCSTGHFYHAVISWYLFFRWLEWGF